MTNARFSGIFLAVPAVGLTMLLVLVLMVIIRVWMVGAPKYTRKHVRFPNRFNYPNPDDQLQAKPRYFPPASSYTITRPGGETAVYSYPVRPQPSYPTMPGGVGPYKQHPVPVPAGYSTT